jgi:uncharacterized SAM-binding protein YcdF (DUF218 family)
VLDPSLTDPLWWRALAKALVLPPGGPLVVALVGFVLMRRRARDGRALALAGVLALAVLSTPAVGVMLLRAVDASPPFDPSQAGGARAIVILGGGTRRNAPEYGGDTLGRLTLERVRYGARVARETSLPVLVTGGVGISGGATEASLMRAALENEFGVPVRWIEDRSRTTHENAQMSAAILKADGIDRVVLVGHSFDMPRARAEFAAAGIATIPAPTGIAPKTSDTLLDFVPSLAGLTDSYYALYELAGEAVRRIVTATSRS